MYYKVLHMAKNAWGRKAILVVSSTIKFGPLPPGHPTYLLRDWGVFLCNPPMITLEEQVMYWFLSMLSLGYNLTILIFPFGFTNYFFGLHKSSASLSCSLYYNLVSLNWYVLRTTPHGCVWFVHRAVFLLQAWRHTCCSSVCVLGHSF